MTQPPRSLEDWESAIDKQIREAMERGEFDHLPGAGKPLDLDENPFAPEDWRLAFKILKDNNVAPEWIEIGKQIRDEMSALAQLLERQTQWQRERLAKTKLLAPDKAIAERERLAQAREQTMRAYRQRAEALNKMIDTFNLKVPNAQLQVPRVRIDEELQRFVEECR
jgi:DnaJ family protein C protein 28